MRISTALLAAACLAAWLPAIEGKTCLMIYQMADNNLEYFIRQDYQELSQSPVVSSADLRTWVYYDALNQGGQALPNTVDGNGNGVGGSFTGTRYVTYDPSFQKMRVDVEFGSELNSDYRSTVQDFLTHAMNDCKANGYNSLFAVFSSHGGGFAGYGGDENGRRNLLQTNQDVALAIRGALDATGAGDGSGMLDVIGFDACLMQAVGAADDYKGVAKYILASEAVEPGHGWAYSYLNTAGSALELAQNIVETFVSQTQGGSYHQTPKTLAIVDSSKFDIFIAAFENFSANMLSLLKGGDKTLHTQLSRARSQSVAFEGIVDAVGSRNPSAVDIGSFLYQFKTICNPGGTLQTDLDTAIGVYYDMLVLTRNGPGTAGVTGMHITWPNQGEFASNPTLWNQVLFNNANYVTSIIPNFREFLSWYLPAGSQAGEIGGDSVCGKGVESPPEQTVSYPDALIQEASGVINPTTGMFEVKTTISPDVSEMRVEYGIDLSTPLKPVLEEKGYIPTDDEHLILLGGDVAGVYDGAQFDAAWDQKFYFLNITGTDTFEALYVADQGGGSKKIPTMYFTDDFREELSELQFLDFLFFDFAGWVEKGARYGFLQFSTDEASGRINDNLSLYISNADGVFSEQPRSAGGMLIPLVYVDAYIQERTLDTLPGGFYQTVIEWSTELDYNILTTSIENVFNIVPDTDAVTISVYAFNHADPAAAVDSKIYDVKRNRGSKPCLSDCTSQSGSSAESDTLQSQNVESSAKATCLSMIAAGVSIMILGFFL